MANNPYVNKVVNAETNTTLIDLTSDTAVAADVAQGKYFHLATGERVQGTSTGGSGTEAGTVTQDQDGYLVLDDEAGSGGVTVEALSITQNGTYTAPTGTAYSPVTVNVSGGGGGGGDMSDPIRFFDYDGTLVASYSSVPDSLPSVPTHDKLTNGTWNYTLAQVTTQFNAMGTCDVGANYETVSGATEIDIELQDGRLHPYLSLAVNGTVSIDWGDNSTSTSTGTSLTTRKSDIHHEYAAAGSYTIKITKTSGAGYSLYCSSIYFLLNKNSSSQNENRVYANCVKAVRVGDDCTFGNYSFGYCSSLESVSIPSSITSIGSYSFYYCYSLKFVSIPSGATSTGSNAFQYCYSLASVSIPSTVTTINTSSFNNCYTLESVSIPSTATNISGSAFSYCYSLASASIPSGVTSIGTNVFSTCQTLTSVTIPSGVTSIGNSLFNGCISLASSVVIPSGVTSIGTYAFSNCCGVAEYHFEPTTPPTLSNTNAFTGIQSDCIIYVPSSKLNDYKTAENWSTYASYMVGE